jgi:uncharacterized protein
MKRHSRRFVPWALAVILVSLRGGRFYSAGVSRIAKAYETRFRWLLQRVNARQLDMGVRRLLEKAQHLRVAQGVSHAEALTRVCEELSSRPAFRHVRPATALGLFYCDAGLGGLARWLRAAGHESLWQPDIDDTHLLHEARRLSATVLTTDSMLMERRLIRDRVIPALWLPPTGGSAAQLAMVFREFGLSPRPPRCMSCGGELLSVDKEANRKAIPPRTYLWLNDYFACARCGKLFWHGTHWRRIMARLGPLAVGSPPTTTGEGEGTEGKAVDK